LAILTGNKMLWLVAIGATYRLFTKDWQTEPDRDGLLQFLGLMAALSMVGRFALQAAGTASVP
jgi:hypothetical protein